MSDPTACRQPGAPEPSLIYTAMFGGGGCSCTGPPGDPVAASALASWLPVGDDAGAGFARKLPCRWRPGLITASNRPAGCVRRSVICYRSGGRPRVRPVGGEITGGEASARSRVLELALMHRTRVRSVSRQSVRTSAVRAVSADADRAISRVTSSAAGAEIEPCGRGGLEEPCRPEDKRVLARRGESSGAGRDGQPAGSAWTARTVAPFDFAPVCWAIRGGPV